MTRLPTGASRWQQAKRVLEGAMELPPAELDGYLDAACDGDPSLRRDVESLLVHAGRGDFLTTGLAPGVAESFDLVETVSLEGHRLGPWKLDKRIGEGGMGAVYLAERADGEYTQRVAVKVVRHRVASESALRRFRAERQILADLDHPNIARLIDAGTTGGGLPYLVMEYVEGEPIDVYCDKRSLTIERRLQLFRQVCSAVQAAHEHHVVHRDLKPANVLITVDGAPKLLDFGIAKLLAPELLNHSVEITATFQRLMTPAFASPEQIRGETISPASDVYSLGVILYGLVCGHSPYDGETEASSSMEHIVCDLKPPAPSQALRSLTSTVGADGEVAALTAEAVSAARGTDPAALVAHLEAGIDATVLKALAKRPADRYATAADLGVAIDAHLQPGAPPFPAMPPAPPARPASDATPVGPDEATAPRPLFAWGHLQAIRRVGEGVFGEVYECRDPSLDTTVALKLFRQPADADVDATGRMLARRILKEGQLLARVRHRNVVLVHGVGVRDSTVGMWMEYLDGRNLEELLQVLGRFSAGEACLIGIELCSALAAVHARGVVHRDIKAQNVIRTEGGRIVLTDFGSGGDLVGETTLSHAGAAGTPLYMAPEVLRGGAATVQSDIYSLGVLLFRLVTGAFPVDAGSWSDLIAKLERGEIALVRDRRPDLGPGAAQVIQTALSIDPKGRFASAGKMQDALEVATHDQRAPGKAFAPDPGKEDREVIRRMAQVTATIAGGLALGLFVMFLGFATVQVYRQAVRIPPDFVTASGLGYVPLGVQTLVPVVILTTIAGLLLVATAFACRGLLWLIERRQPARGRLRSLAVRARALEGAVAAANPENIATVIAGMGSVAIVGITFAYLDMWRALIALMEDTTAANADLSQLDLPSLLYTFFLSAVVAGILLGCAAASRLTQRPQDRRSALRLLRGAPLAVIAAAVVLMAAPWKTIYAPHQPAIYLPAPPEAENDSDVHRWAYRNGERIDLNGRRALIIADNGTEAWLYFPEIRKSARVGSAFVDAVGDPTPIFRHLGGPKTQ